MTVGKLFAATWLILVAVGTALSQQVDQFPLPSGENATPGPVISFQGMLWVMESGQASEIAGFAPDGTVETRIPLPVPALGLTGGPDGNLWFTTADAIGKADPVSGSLVTYPLPTPSNVPGGITTGADGALWFREILPDGSGRIGRITTDGAITEFPLAISGRPVDQIIGSSDGAIWYTNLWANGQGAIGRMTPDGTASGFLLDVSPTHYTSNGIAIGSDGGTWFTEVAAAPFGGGTASAARIARSGADGMLTEYVLPSDKFGFNAGPIVSGPDGALWFVFDGAHIGRLTGSGGLTSLQFQQLSNGVGGMTFGPDGNIWLTSSTASGWSLLRYSVPAALPCADDPQTLCLNNSRFLVDVVWTDFQGNTGVGNVVSGVSSSDSGLFWFFGPTNWELLIKVLDGCGGNGHYWVFGAAATDVGYTIQVTDTQSGTVKTYTNPLGTTSPAITDTAAFPGCP